MERILLVSATEKSRTMLSQFLTSCGVQAQLAPASSGAEARRMLVDGSFDLILVNTPLPDEFGHDMAQQAVNDTLSGVILLAKAEIADSVAEKVEDDGVFVVPKPLSRVLFMQALRMTRAARSRPSGGPRQVSAHRVLRHDRAGGAFLHRAAGYEPASLQARHRRGYHRRKNAVICAIPLKNISYLTRKFFRFFRFYREIPDRL